MALSPLTPADAGEGARAKINAGITEADKVSGLAAILAALQIQLAPYIDLVGGAPDRPGDARTLFTRVMTGSPKARPAIDKGTIEDGGELGQVLRISGADTDPGLGYIDVAPRRAYYMRPGRTYLVQHHFKRFQNPSDPLQHAVELRFQNLSSTFGIVSNVRLGDPYAPTEANGAFFIDTFVGKAGAPGTPSYIVPPTSAYGVPFFRIYGNGHQTDLGTVRLYDVSDALAGGADVASILARVKKLEDGQLAGVTYASSWADLASRVGKVAGAGARTPDSDTGTHVDPVTGATVSNAGNFLWSVAPPGWQWISVTDARQAADFVGSAIPIAPIETAPTLQLAFRDPSTSRLTVLSAADSKAYIEASMAGPTTYVWPAHTSVSAESKEIIPFDEGLKEFAIVNIGASKVHATQGGLPAKIGGDGSTPLESGGGSWGTDLVQRGAVSAISESASKLTVTFRTTTNYNVALRAASDAYIARIASRGVVLTTAQANALRDFYADIYTSGAFSVLGGFYNFRGPAAAAYMNLCDISAGFADNNGGLTATSWRNVNFDGSTGWIDTRLKLAAMARPNDFSLLAYPGDTTNQGSTRVALGDGNVTLTPNRTNTTVAFRALGNTLYSPAGFTAGPGLVSMSCVDVAKATIRQKKAVSLPVAISGGEAAFSDRSVLLGARNGGVTGQAASPASGSFFLGPQMFLGLGGHLTDTMHNAISDACDKFVAATGAF